MQEVNGFLFYDRNITRNWCVSFYTCQSYLEICAFKLKAMSVIFFKINTDVYEERGVVVT